MNRVISQILCTAMLLPFVSCAKDLPQRDPESEISRAITKAQVSESRARVALEAARLERQKSEALLAEARRVSDQNRLSCEIRCREEGLKRSRAAAKVKAHEAQSAQKPSEPKDPEFSPSDAPEGWKQK